MPGKAIPTAPRRASGTDDLTFVRQLQALGHPFVANSFGLVFAFSHAHLQYFLTDDATRQLELDILQMQEITAGPLHEFIDHSLLFSNGEVHRRRRTPLARAFAFPLMDALRPAVRQEAQALIRPLIGKGPTPFLEAVAGPFPARIVAGILGLPDADIPAFTRRVYSAIRGLSIQRSENIAATTEDTRHLLAYVAELLADRRRTPQDDFLSQYVARTAESPLSEAEVRAQIVTLILAGSDTTRAALTAILSRLLHTPDQWSLLKDDPDRHLQGAVAEGLRLEPVIGSYARVTTRQLELEGYHLPAGTIVGPLSLTALRDPEIYADPDTMDITRRDHPRLHPIFGAGPHRCLGEALARIELEEALRVIATEAPETTCIGPPAELRGLGAVREVVGMTVEFAA
ncbi:cytochrome P450 [Algicella marina]|nr:cytochrome P450 [Algicella marina]